MTVSIRRVSAGTGYRYLMQSVAAGDGARAAATPLTRYYAEAGTPAGRWMGQGLAGLDGGRGVAAGSEVSELQLFHLLGQGADPITGAPLGRAPNQQRSGSSSSAVAGFDVTFSVPKSVSVVWAVADVPTQERIVEAHHAAVREALAYAEREIFATRVGSNGVAQRPVQGVVAAAFDHCDSRASDPHLHTHVVVANRVQAIGDGRWRTLDSRALYRAVVALSELHQGLVMDRITRVLGVDWEATARRQSSAPQYDIAGVPAGLRAEFSRRTEGIDAEKDRLIADYRRAHGHDPSARTVLRLRQQATLATRPEKQMHSLTELTEQWRARARAHVGDLTSWLRSLPRVSANADREADLSVAEVQLLAEAALSGVAEKRATFSRWNIAAEAHRQLQPIRFRSAANRILAADRMTDSALGMAVLVSGPQLASTPAAFRRSDGASEFDHRGAARYTTAAVLAAEDHLLALGRDRTGFSLSREAVARSLASSSSLAGEQAAAIEQIASAGRVLDVLVGAAGTGKTSAMRGLLGVWQSQFGDKSVVGLAPSASAADTLAAELGIAAENTAKFLTEAGREPQRLARIDHLRALSRRADPLSGAAAAIAQALDETEHELARWRLRAGQLVIVDEASLAGTPTLDRLASLVEAAGAKLLLVGDPYQLSAVESGGAFAMLVRDRDDAPELLNVQRFAHQWERAASTALRLGDRSAIDAYERQQRLHDGGRPFALESAYAAWRNDRLQGRQSLLLAADRDTVRELNHRAQADLITAGVVHPGCVGLGDGTSAGAGDVIVTRRNDRTLDTGAGWVKNGDRWQVLNAHADGSLSVQRATGTGAVKLPADYVAEHVELGYASTAHRAQGQTVDTAHAIVTGPGMTREALYVAMTRGRHANHAYVVTDHDADPDTAHGPAEPQTSRSVLTAVLANSGADVSARDTIRTELDTAGGWPQLLAEYDTIAAHAQAERWSMLIDSAAPDRRDAMLASPAFPALAAALRRADAAGLDVDHTLPRIASARELDSALDAAAVLHERVERWIGASSRQAPTAGTIAGLHPAARGITDPDTAAALQERAELLELRARNLAQIALNTDQPWARALGPAPLDPLRRQQYLRFTATIAAHRDLRAITSDDPLGPPDTARTAYTQDRETACRAAVAARLAATELGGTTSTITPTVAPDAPRL